MAKKSTYGFESVLARNKALATDLENLLLREMHYLGIESQGHARNNAGYTDRTGNLKNSIGYHIIHDNQEVASGSVGKDNPLPSPNGEGSLQVSEQQKNERLVHYDKFANGGLSLILVAGMQYASAVEAKGFNVLDLTWREAKRNAKEDIDIIIKKVAKKYGTKTINPNSGR